MKTLNLAFLWIPRVVVLSALTWPVFAVDGVILINQNAALSGGVVPFDSAGFPVTILQAGSYRLSSNLVVPDRNTTAIEIVASDVPIDMNGFSILGPVECTGFPVTSCGPSASSGGIVGLIDRN